ncbi:MAG TPA: Co2+/Mg2+ efflux protein ApaG [Stellaceae bacterium]|nr:Co2+/Mg2+ efflux protein ApaG [Stellaceae bacterium]
MVLAPVSPSKPAAGRGSAAAYSATTRSIKVVVKPFYLEDQSSPPEDHYVWAYHVRIENHGAETVQLRRRHWRITDALGRMQEVKGAGVVGEQPILKPGEAFEYTSGTPLPTPSGIMVGSYEMETKAGESFAVDIPAFSLDSPHQAIRLN